jgi:hypothetical protein
MNPRRAAPIARQPGSCTHAPAAPMGWPAPPGGDDLFEVEPAAPDPGEALLGLLSPVSQPPVVSIRAMAAVTGAASRAPTRVLGVQERQAVRRSGPDAIQMRSGLRYRLRLRVVCRSATDWRNAGFCGGASNLQIGPATLVLLSPLTLEAGLRFGS